MVVAIWIDEDREHDGPAEAFTEGANLLTKQEWNAIWSVFVILGILSFISGSLMGAAVEQHRQDTTETALMPPEGDVAQAIAASKNDTIVDAFCEGHGFEAGYPSANTGGGYVIQCYDNSGDVDRGKEFSMFNEFADYVAESIESSRTRGDSR